MQSPSCGAATCFTANQQGALEDTNPRVARDTPNQDIPGDGRQVQESAPQIRRDQQHRMRGGEHATVVGADGDMTA